MALYYSEGKKLHQYIASVSVCMGAFTAGVGLAWIANIALDLKEGSLNDIEMTDYDLSLIGSLFTVGALPACVAIGPLCNWLGRKITLIIFIFPSIAGWLLVIFSTNVEMIKAARFIMGMTLGAFSAGAPLYTSEVVESQIRGRTGSFFALFLTIGIAYTAVTGYLCSSFIHTALCFVPPALFLTSFPFQPETPIHSLRNGNEIRARAAICYLRGGEGYDVDGELRELKSTVRSEILTDATSILASLKQRHTIRAIVIVFGQMFFQQMGGINAIVFYTTTIFESGGASMNPKIVTILVGLVQLFSGIISSIFVENLGRKVLLLISGGLMGVSTLIIGVFFTLLGKVNKETIDIMGFLPILGLCLVLFAFNIGYGPIPWMMSAEVFPPESKAFLGSGAAFFSWTLACVVTGTYFPIRNAFGIDVTFYIFSCFSFIGVIYVFFLVFETKGMTTEDIQIALKNGDIS